MSRISNLSEELLIKILSFLPTKVAVSTSILSKQWQFLWMWLPKLEYNLYRTRYVSEPPLKKFIDKNLPLHRAPVVESLRLSISDKLIIPEDIRRWIEIAVSRHVRELEISYYSENQNIFPSSFYTCESLVILKLEYMALMDVVPSMVCLPSLKTLKLRYATLIDVPSTVCLPSLKTLELESVKHKSNESLQRLLSICPVLEELLVDFCTEHVVGEFILEKFSIIVPSLQRLSLFIDDDAYYLDRYVIDTPSLVYFKLEDWNDLGHDCEIKNMPNLREAYVYVAFFRLKSVVKSITSVKCLTICSEILKEGGQDGYGGGFVFNELEHLKICLCKKYSSNVLAQFLKDSPNLRVLEISHMNRHGFDELNRMVCGNQPSHVPECLLSSLQTFTWSRYFGRRQDREIAVYLLKNARRLETATILADTWEHNVPNLRMVKELTLSSRASSRCELVFLEGHDVVADESLTEDSSE
ncbi:unnamed protein product [Microthlaspi erraticum]|uniref:FBD domain-containing protein n=1 Tax=Microthlaspi erraticum TaxID=1685480 RepID=A0A6D2KR13_9BRAS|nr:unnamed protein product [Microthlaspi erraticum]